MNAPTEELRKPVCECNGPIDVNRFDIGPIEYLVCGKCAGIIFCEFCPNQATTWTPGDDFICNECGNEILENAP